MSESAGKTRRASRGGGEGGGRDGCGRGGGTARPEHPRAAFPRRLCGVLGGRPARRGGAGPGVSSPGRPCEPVAPRTRRHGHAGERGQAALPPLREPAGGGSAHRGDRGRGPGGRLHAAPRLHHGLHAGRRGVPRRRHGRARCGMRRALGRALSGAVGPPHELSPSPRPAASSRRRPGKCLRRAACFWPLAPGGGAPVDERGDHWACRARGRGHAARSPSGNFCASGDSCCAAILCACAAIGSLPKARHGATTPISSWRGCLRGSTPTAARVRPWRRPGSLRARPWRASMRACSSSCLPPFPTSLPSWRRPRWMRRGTLPSTGTCGRIRWRDRAARWCSAAR